MGQKILKDLLTLDEAIGLLFKTLPPKPEAIEVELLSACGRVLAEDVESSMDIPPFAKSAMDGYAVRAADTYGASDEHPVTLHLMGHIRAGDYVKQKVEQGACMQVDTGGAIPPGTDAVVIVEDTMPQPGHILAYKSVTPGQNVMMQGSDVAAGSTVLFAGTELSERTIPLLATIGKPRITVFRAPTVGIVITGNELIQPGEKLVEGKIYNSNAYGLVLACKRAGANPELLQHLPDNEKLLVEKFQDAAGRFDVVITSGGTSAGAGDFVYSVVEKIGFKLIFHGIKMKPGKPTFAATNGRKLIIGLPGNPVSSLMAFYSVFYGYMRAMSGLGLEQNLGNVTGIAEKRFDSAQGRRDLIPVSVREKQGELYFSPTPGGSGAVSALAHADGFIDIPEDQTVVEQGSRHSIHFFAGARICAQTTIAGIEDAVVDSAIARMRNQSACRRISLVDSKAVQAVVDGNADVAIIWAVVDGDGGTNLDTFLRDYMGKVEVVKGSRRPVGIAAAKENPLHISAIDDLLRCRIVNRLPGTGIRNFLDRQLKSTAARSGGNVKGLLQNLDGHNYCVKTHDSVCFTISYGRADAGITSEAAATRYGLPFIRLAEEECAVVFLKSSADSESIKRLIQLVTGR